MRALAAVVLLAATAAGCTGDGSGTTAPEPTPSASTARGSGSSTSATTEPHQARLDEQLRAAAWENDVRRARRLIARGADVNAEDETQQSAYLVATSEGHRDLLELTLRNGADVNAKDSFNGTGLIRAADRGHWAIAGRLVRAGVEIDHVNNLGWTALHEAILLGDGSRRYLDTVRVLTAAGADVTLPSAGDGVTPVEHARAEQYAAIAELLTRAIRTDADVPDPRAASRRLLAAAATGDADAAIVALRAGARLEARDQRRRTPLQLAVTHGRRAVARLLVALGADPDARSVTPRRS